LVLPAHLSEWGLIGCAASYPCNENKSWSGNMPHWMHQSHNTLENQTSSWASPDCAIKERQKEYFQDRGNSARVSHVCVCFLFINSMEGIQIPWMYFWRNRMVICKQ
jgi:hypothetical protein